jgi:hypothetical protein
VRMATSSSVSARLRTTRCSGATPFMLPVVGVLRVPGARDHAV